MPKISKFDLIRFFKKILVDFFRFDFWLQLLESSYYYLQIEIKRDFLAQFVEELRQLMMAFQVGYYVCS